MRRAGEQSAPNLITVHLLLLPPSGRGGRLVGQTRQPHARENAARTLHARTVKPEPQQAKHPGVDKIFENQLQSARATATIRTESSTALLRNQFFKDLGSRNTPDELEDYPD